MKKNLYTSKKITFFIPSFNIFSTFKKPMLLFAALVLFSHLYAFESQAAKTSFSANVDEEIPNSSAESSFYVMDLTAVVNDYDAFCSDDNNTCSADVDITIEVVSLCVDASLTLEGDVDIDNDGTSDGSITISLISSVDTLTTYTITGNYPIGSHLFNVSIEDDCGNSLDLAIPFEVVDCRAPTPTCIAGLTIVLEPGADGCCARQVWASDLISSSTTDCTGPVKYSIIRLEDDILTSITGGTEIPSQEQTGVILDCNDDPTVQLNIYAWDSADNPYAVQPDGSVGGNNYDRCVTYVLVQNGIACTMDLWANVVTNNAFCAYSTDCIGEVDVEMEVVSICFSGPLTVEGLVDLYNDGTFDGDAFISLTASSGSLNTYNITGDYPLGNHLFSVSIEDDCGNTFEIEVPFEVVDCKASAPICIAGLTIDIFPQPDGCCAMALWATDFIGSPITDCSEPIKYSIIRFDDDILTSTIGGTTIPTQEQTGIILDCNDAETVNVNIYAWDSADNPYAVQPDGSVGGNNYDRCVTYAVIQNFCDPVIDGKDIAGQVETENGDGVQDVILFLSGSSFQNTSTDDTGSYAFEDEVSSGYDYTITPYLNTQSINALSTFDMILLIKHILGIEALDSPYKMIAADVNNSGTLTVGDLVSMQFSILGYYDEFPNNTFWRFVDADYVFPDPSNPWAEVFPEVRHINAISQDELNENFIGIAIGDLNGSVLPNLVDDFEERNANGAFGLTTAEKVLKKGNDYRASFSGKDIDKVMGYQFTLAFDKTALDFQKIEYGIAQEENIGLKYIEEGLLTTTWNAFTGEIDENEELFTIHFYAKADTKLSEVLTINSQITKAEAYNHNSELLDVKLNFINKTTTDHLELYQNTPNPFTNATVIGFNLPTDELVHLIIQDVSGKTIQTITKNGIKGYNSIVINAETLHTTGLLMYTISADTFTATKRMFVVE